MIMYFWQFCDASNCIRQWIFFVITVIIFLYTAYSIVNTYRYHQRIIFQLLPLSINSLATGFLLMLQLFQKGFQYHLATYIIQIYTYFLFCYTFTVMYVRVKNLSNTNQVKKIANTLLLTFTIGIFLILVFIFLKKIVASCQKVFTDAYYIFFASEIGFYFITLYFGVKIYKQIDHHQQLQLTVLLAENQSLQNHKLLKSDQYLNQRKNQISLILISYTLTVAFRILSVILNNIFSSSINCIYIDEVFIRGSDTILGKTIIILNSTIQVIPHVLIPAAMYIIPSTQQQDVLTRQNISKDLDDSDLLSNSEIKKQQNMRVRLSTLINSNYSQI